MIVKRQICTTWSKSQIKVLKKYDIDIEEGFSCIFLKEDEIYFELEPYFNKWEVFNARGFDYSKKEIMDAKYAIVSGCNVGGYPMPDGDFGYLELTYDKIGYCEKCGVGKIQKDSFRLKNVPKYNIFRLTWVYDEIFVNKDVYNQIFKPLGILYKDVKLLKGDKKIDSVVQLVIPETIEELKLKDYKSQTCSKCGITKYEAQAQGFFPLHKNPLPNIYKSKEYFGDGAAADKKIFISAKLRDILIEGKIMKYSWFIPCNNDNQ
jgi:hypothetical protein